VHHQLHQPLGPGLHGNNKPPPPLGDHRVLDQLPVGVDEGTEVLGEGTNKLPTLAVEEPKRGGGVLTDPPVFVDHPADGGKEEALIRELLHQTREFGITGARELHPYPHRCFDEIGHHKELLGIEIPVFPGLFEDRADIE